MIRSFKDWDIEMVFTRRLPIEIQKRALTKLLIIAAAESEMDLRNPPSNHLEKLR